MSRVGTALSSRRSVPPDVGGVFANVTACFTFPTAG
jgi:hypothetical protein